MCIPEVRDSREVANRGGCWFIRGALKVHLGVDEAFNPARKAHPGFLVGDLAALSRKLLREGHAIESDEPLEGYRRAYVSDPFGNRIELLEPVVRAPAERSNPTEQAPYRSCLLLVVSSLFGKESLSGRLALQLIAGWKDLHPDAFVVERNLDADPVPHLTRQALLALGASAPKLDSGPISHGELSDMLIDELERAHTVVLAAPMYNFSIPSTLKAWIDHVACAGRTFRYGPGGPEGLLRDKRVFIVTARGGVYRSESGLPDRDCHEPYLRTILEFLGLTDITFIYAEGQRRGVEMAARGIDAAKAAIREIVEAERRRVATTRLQTGELLHSAQSPGEKRRRAPPDTE